ncbi:MAG: hypothetical protein HYZ57_05400, partial [Acidobacteria bacterium]|nr:hypothetical protein [Acidobacteriota bacterium]
MPQRFVFSGGWELPFGKGRAFANSGPARLLAGNWNLAGILSLSDGVPFTLNLPFDNAN